MAINMLGGRTQPALLYLRYPGMECIGPWGETRSLLIKLNGMGKRCALECKSTGNEQSRD